MLKSDIELHRPIQINIISKILRTETCVQVKENDSYVAI